MGGCLESIVFWIIRGCETHIWMEVPPGEHQLDTVEHTRTRSISKPKSPEYVALREKVVISRIKGCGFRERISAMSAVPKCRGMGNAGIMGVGEAMLVFSRWNSPIKEELNSQSHEALFNRVFRQNNSSALSRVFYLRCLASSVQGTVSTR